MDPVQPPQMKSAHPLLAQHLMKHSSIRLLSSISLLGGCIVTTSDAPIYDRCVDVFDCDPAASRCQRIVADWPEATVADNICTVECFSDLDCPFNATGVGGICASFGMGRDTVCYEACIDSGDCGFGFDCGEISTGDTVCLPR